MGRQATSFVLAYHGCGIDIAKDVVLGNKVLKASSNSYDWLGKGIYFWESDPQRAWEWADEHVRRSKIQEAAVIGAVIDLGNCLDLISRTDLELVATAHAQLLRDAELSEYTLPKNRNPEGQEGNDLLFRALDCAVINYLHKRVEDPHDNDFSYPPFDSVRGLFTEGEALYENSGFQKKNHIQIAVSNPSCLKGVFLADR